MSKIEWKEYLVSIHFSFQCNVSKLSFVCLPSYNRETKKKQKHKIQIHIHTLINERTYASTQKHIIQLNNKQHNLQFWSLSSMSILSFCTHSCTEAACPGMPLLMLMSTAITVLMHSYSSDIAVVLHTHKRENK